MKTTTIILENNYIFNSIESYDEITIRINSTTSTFITITKSNNQKVRINTNKILCYYEE